MSALMAVEDEVTFRPDEAFMISDLAVAVGVTRGGASSWVNARLASGAIPHPLFVLTLRDNKIVRVWSGEQGREMVALYQAQRRAR